MLRLPIAHGEGNYHAPPDLLAQLEDEGRVVFRYSDADGTVTTAAANPNGSVDGIAGICNEARNVVGLMPHPERASERDLGCADGRVFWDSLLSPGDGMTEVGRLSPDPGRPSRPTRHCARSP